MNELALIESRSLRAEYSDKIDVLERVKKLTMLPDDIHASTDLVAAYYEVDVDAIESVVRRNREELDSYGYVVLRGDELREFETVNLTGSKRRAFALFPKRAILNVGTMLDKSAVAREVRRALIDGAEQAWATTVVGRRATLELAEVVSFDEAMAVYLQERGVDYTTPYFTRILRAAGYLRQNGCEPRKKKRKFFFFNGTSWEIRSWALSLLFFEFEATMRELSPTGWNQPFLEGLDGSVLSLKRGES